MGQRLADLPNLRAELARMNILTDAQAAFVHQVAWKMEHPQAGHDAGRAREQGVGQRGGAAR